MSQTCLLAMSEHCLTVFDNTNKNSRYVQTLSAIWPQEISSKVERFVAVEPEDEQSGLNVISMT